MTTISLIALSAAVVLLIPVFGNRKGKRGLKVALLIIADICLGISQYATLVETGTHDILNYLVFAIINILAIRQIFTPVSPNQEQYDKWHSDPTNWKAGIIYYNPDDKRYFPPKRIRGMGWTINFANPYSVLAFMGLCVFIIVIIKLFK